MPGTAWSETEKQALFNMLSDGMTVRECEKKLDRSYRAIRQAIDRFGFAGLNGQQRQAGVSYTDEPQNGHAPPDFEDWDVPEDVDWREFFATWGNINELHKQIDPSQQFLTIGLSHVKNPIMVVSASDLHMGGGFTDHREIRKTIDFILETDNCYVGFTGDGIEGFVPGEKSAETVEQMPASLKAQLAAYRGMVRELSEAKKILWATWGDHDGKWFEKLVGINFVKQTIHSTVPYFNGRGLIRLKLGNQEYFLCVNHAERFASQWNKNHPQRRQYEQFFPADVNIAGHRHKPAFQMDWHYEAMREAGLPIGGKHWLIANGTFKTGPDPYSIRGWTKGVMGTPTIVFYPDVHDCDVFETPLKALAYMRGLCK